MISHRSNMALFVAITMMMTSCVSAECMPGINVTVYSDSDCKSVNGGLTTIYQFMFKSLQDGNATNNCFPTLSGSQSMKIDCDTSAISIDVYLGRECKGIPAQLRAPWGNCVALTSYTNAYAIYSNAIATKVAILATLSALFAYSVV